MSERNYQLLFDRMLNGFALCEIILDESGTPRDYRFLDVNPAFEALTGLTRAQVIGRTVREVLPDLEPHWIETYGRVALSGEPVRFENYVAALDKYFEVQAYSPQRGHFVALFADITERKRLEEQLRQAQKMEAIGALAGGIAHNFNNLLTGVIGFAEFALSEQPPGSQAAQDIERVLAGARQMAELTRWLLAFARRQMIRPVQVNLNELLTRFDKVLIPALGGRVTLNLHLSPDLWPVRVDPAQIEQALLNLAFNAQAAMPDGGQFTIETANVVLNPASLSGDGLWVRSEDLPPGDYVRLAVSDTGCGIDAKTLPRIFEPFFSTKGLAEATGLGLAATYGIIRQHGGDIWVTSEPGRGTRFEIYLPRAG